MQEASVHTQQKTEQKGFLVNVVESEDLRLRSLRARDYSCAPIRHARSTPTQIVVARHNVLAHVRIFPLVFGFQRPLKGKKKKKKRCTLPLETSARHGFSSPVPRSFARLIFPVSALVAPRRSNRFSVVLLNRSINLPSCMIKKST